MGGRSFRLPIDDTTRVVSRAIFLSSAIFRLKGTHLRVEIPIWVSTVSRTFLSPTISPPYCIATIRKYLFQFRGDLGLLANTKPPATYPDRPYTEEQFNHLYDIINHAADMGIARSEGYGLDHPHTLHAFLVAGTAYYHLGQDDKALPLLEQVYILGDYESRPEHTIEPAVLLNYYYRKTNFERKLQALEARALHPKLRSRK